MYKFLIGILFLGLSASPACAGGSPGQTNKSPEPGALIPVAGSACWKGAQIKNCFAAGYEPVAIVASPNEHYVYVVNHGGSTILSYAIGAGGSLVPTTAPQAGGADCDTAKQGKNCIDTGIDPWSAAIGPQGRYLYNSNGTLGISALRVGTGGVLTPIGGKDCEMRWGHFHNCFVAPGDDDTMAIAVDPKAHYVYVADAAANRISVFRIAAGGVLKPIAGSADCAHDTQVHNCYVTGSDPSSLAVGPKGRYLYVALESDSVAAFRIGADGKLTPIAGHACILYPSPTHESPPDNCVAAGDDPTSIAVDPNGRYVYVANSGQGEGRDVSAYRIGKNGALTPVAGAACHYLQNNKGSAHNCFSAGLGPQSVAVDPTGRFVYVANNSGGDVSAYKIGLHGKLIPIPGAACGRVKGVFNCFAAGSSPWGIGIAPSGRYVYVTNNQGGNVSAYRISRGGQGGGE